MMGIALVFGYFLLLLRITITTRSGKSEKVDDTNDWAVGAQALRLGLQDSRRGENAPLKA